MRELDNSNHDYSENIAEAIKKHFDDNDWNYAFDEDNGIFMASINIGDKLNTINLILHVHDDAFTIYFVIPVNAGKKVRSKVTEFITRANYGMRCANFEMDYSDGEIRLKIFTPVHTEELSDYTIGFSIFLGVTIIKRYGI